ncbi:indirect negative regulator of sigma-B activity [Halalkalibacillus sediminis]|uniref:Indirect negative regulator of sigma-B activity n=1 Tax=Halalkalibacillus sediminis TaxID=2018042 RepID=A0A2I0QRP2_9BACI|nr:SpoIIE family protein phosphatase [Halalkalibacillus sediminis]PKR77002.1 indirect negative regulator of sigma-B activity [Halalkalibacillus sediminis]
MIDRKDHMEVATFQKPKKGNYYSGDRFFYLENKNYFIGALADGLGSGEMAKASADVAMDVIQENHHQSLEVIFDKCNEALIGTELRGCVLSIIKLDFTTNTYCYASVGNIGVITLFNDGKKHRSIPVSGYLSGIKRKVKVHEHPLKENTVFFLFSDGVNERTLTKDFYSHQSMQLTVDWYENQLGDYMDDDTTLVAMKYLG